MAAPKSVNAQVGFGVQVDKSTVATTGICGIQTQSGHNPQFDYNDGGDVEHSCYAISRPTSTKAVDDPSGVIHAWSIGGRLYPDLLPLIFIGGGCKAVATSPKNHRLTIAGENDQKYISMSHLIKHGDGDLQRTLIGCRTGEIALTAARSGITYTASGFGLTETQDTISKTPDTNQRFAPSSTEITVTIDGVSFTVNCETSVLTFTNELQTGDDRQKLTQYERDDVPILSVDVTGSYTGLDLTKADYKLLNYDNNDAIRKTRPTGSITTTYKTLGATPYTFTYHCPLVQFTSGEFEANGSDSILFDLSWQMVDAPGGGDPFELTVTNEVASYY